jgi:hypothetical protein
MVTGDDVIRRGESFLKGRMTVVIPTNFQRLDGVTDPGTVESHFGDLVFNPRIACLVCVYDLKHAVAFPGSGSE